MASNDKAVIYYESGQNAFALTAMTTTDNQTFSAGTIDPISNRAGFEAKIMPYGVVNGGALTPATAADDVSVAAVVVQMPAATGAGENGQLTVSGGDVSCARPSTDTHLIYSITVDNTGSLAAVAGSEGTSFSESRGVAGSAPYIPVDSIEIGQVRYATQTSDVLSTSEIKQVPGVHVELAQNPIITSKDFAAGEIGFAAALPLIHTDDTPKPVYIEGYTAIFAEVPDGYDYAPAEESYSTNSQQVYGRSVGSTSISLGQAGFNALLEDGHTDAILNQVGQNVWTKFKQNKNRAPYMLTQGILGLARTFPASGNVGATFTQSAESKSTDYAG